VIATKASDIECPRCPAQPGEACRDRSGRDRRTNHAARNRAVMADPYLASASPQPAAKAKFTLNKHAFRCPRCGRWTPELTEMIIRDRDEWIHGSCLTDERRRKVRTTMLATAMPDHCHTCHGRVHAGNRTVNVEGNIVHNNGCPTRRRRPAG